MEYNEEWEPLFEEDYKLDFIVDPFSFMRYRVFDLNEAWDAFIKGFRGNGKSSVALSCCLLLNPRLLDMSPAKALERCWCFTTEERNEKARQVKRGDVLAFDEQGTQKGGSSYKWQDATNQDYADEKQLDRTDGVINLGISLDEMRVLKRIRQLYRVEIYPEVKLSNRDTKGNGMAIDCIVREVVENPFGDTENERFKKKYFNYAPKGRISRVRIPHPPADIWQEYSRRREEFKESLRDEAAPMVRGSRQELFQQAAGF